MSFGTRFANLGAFWEFLHSQVCRGREGRMGEPAWNGLQEGKPLATWEGVWVSPVGGGRLVFKAL